MTYKASELQKTNSKSGMNKNILIFGVIVFLVLVVGVLSAFNRSDRSDLQEGQLRIVAGDKMVANVTIADLKKLPSVKKDLTVSTSKGKEVHKYTGVSLLTVLQQHKLDVPGKYSSIIAKGMDGYTSSIKIDELLIPDNVYLMYLDNDKPLQTMKHKPGSMQVVICNDAFGQRFTKYLVELDVE